MLQSSEGKKITSMLIKSEQVLPNVGSTFTAGTVSTL